MAVFMQPRNNYQVKLGEDHTKRARALTGAFSTLENLRVIHETRMDCIADHIGALQALVELCRMNDLIQLAVAICFPGVVPATSSLLRWVPVKTERDAAGTAVGHRFR